MQEVEARGRLSWPREESVRGATVEQEPPPRHAASQVQLLGYPLTTDPSSVPSVPPLALSMYPESDL